MKIETAGKVKYGIWGLIFGAVLTMVVGFAWGGWTTNGTVLELTKDAVLSKQSDICVAQFMNNSDHEKKLIEFEKLNSYSRSDFVEKGGWDKMPGQQEADISVSRVCAEGIELVANI